MIENKELKYIGYALAFSFVWMVFIVPYLMNAGYSNNCLLSFLIFNVGVFLIIQIVFKGLVLGNSLKFSELAGLILIANAVDLMAPPYMVNTLGQMSSSAMLATSSTDYLLGTLWQSAGINGFFLYVAVYVVTPVLLFILAALLLKNFVKRL